MNDSGYVIIENVLTGEECYALASELSDVINARRRAGARHLMSNDSVAKLAADNAPTWALNRIVALRVHLDSSTSENGPLRVIPGTHQEGALTY